MTVTAAKTIPTLAIADIADADVAIVIALWQACGLTRPWNDPTADIALARRGPNSTILIGRDGDAIVATVMVGHDAIAAGSITSPPILIAAPRAMAAPS